MTVQITLQIGTAGVFDCGNYLFKTFFPSSRNNWANSFLKYPSLICRNNWAASGKMGAKCTFELWPLKCVCSAIDWIELSDYLSKTSSETVQIASQKVNIPMHSLGWTFSVRKNTNHPVCLLRLTICCMLHRTFYSHIRMAASNLF